MAFRGERSAIHSHHATKRPGQVEAERSAKFSAEDNTKLLSPQDRVENPTPTDVMCFSPAVGQNLLVFAASVLKCIGEIGIVEKSPVS
ncbi:MAG: hypothetical protein L0241_03470 [Planctomycetia bacterium]|nr:hypothetical protein [Planctomycetia bacterium]